MSAFLQACQAVYDTPFATAIRESDNMFSLIESVHVLSLALVAGMIAIVDLRLLDVVYREVPADVVDRQFVRATWIGFMVMALSGGLLLVAEAAKVCVNPAAWVKFALMGLAGLNVILFQFTVRRRIQDWREAARAPTGARMAAGVSLVLWVGVIAAGRAIAYFH